MRFDEFLSYAASSCVNADRGRLRDPIAENRRRCPKAALLAGWLYEASRLGKGTTRELIEAMGWDVEWRAGEHGVDLTDDQVAQWKAQAEALLVGSEP